MGRQRSYQADTVVGAARDLFWEQGYAPTSVGHLERRTGLNRSSLYQAFGSKRDLFGSALRRYVEHDVEEMLGGLRRPGAGPPAVIEFFSRLADAFRADPARAACGCLMVNSIAELGQRDQGVMAAAAAHRDRLRKTFAAALAGGGTDGAGTDFPEPIRRRAELLTAATIGIFLGVRIDPAAAADMCDSIAAEVSSWASH